MNRETITIADILGLNPWAEYTRDRLETIFAGRESLTAIDVCDLAGVPTADKLWLLLRGPLFTKQELRLFAARWADRVLPIFERDRPGDSRPRNCIATARRYALGEATAGELAAARAAAWDAARDAARDARDAQLADVRAVLTGDLDILADARAAIAKATG